MSKTSKNGIRYDDEFRQQAVALVVEEGLSVNRAAKDLGVSAQSLQRWVDQYREHSSPGASLAREEEIRRLKKELELVKTERDILKKAVGIFSRPQK